MWAKASLTHSLGVCDFNHTHSFASFQYIQGFLISKRSSWPTVSEMVHAVQQVNLLWLGSKRHHSFSLSCDRPVRLIYYCWPVHHSYIALRATSIVQHTKFQIAMVFLWQPAMDRCKVQAWSTTNAFPASRAISIVQYSKLQMVKIFLWQTTMEWVLEFTWRGKPNNAFCYDIVLCLTLNLSVYQ